MLKTFQKHFLKESAHLFTKSDLNLHTALHLSKHSFGNKFGFFNKNVPNYPCIKIIFIYCKTLKLKQVTYTESWKKGSRALSQLSAQPLLYKSLKATHTHRCQMQSGAVLRYKILGAVLPTYNSSLTVCHKYFNTHSKMSCCLQSNLLEVQANQMICFPSFQWCYFLDTHVGHLTWGW